MVSINVNRAALQAVQAAAAASVSLSETERRITTGLRVRGTKDDSAIFNIAQGVRGDIMGWQAVTSSLSRWKSITDVAVNGASEIDDLILQLKQKALNYSGAPDAQSKDVIRADMEQLIKQIDTITDSSEYSGVNLLKGQDMTSMWTPYAYSGKSSTVNPLPFVNSRMSALPPGSSYAPQYTSYHVLPPSPLTPATFNDARKEMIGGPKTVTIDGGTTAGRINMVFDSLGAADTIEIWQNGHRVAATGQPYPSELPDDASSTPDGEAAPPVVGPGTPVSGSQVLSFDYDPANGQDLEFRINPSGSSSNQIFVGGLELQDPDEPVPASYLQWEVGSNVRTGEASVDTPSNVTNPEDVADALDDPLDPLDVPLHIEGSQATYTLNGGANAARVDMLFDAFDRPDTLEVWQDGSRIAATGQAYVAGGGPVDAATAVSGANVISFDYDPAKGPVTFKFNEQSEDSHSAWVIGAVSVNAVGTEPTAQPSSTDFSYGGGGAELGATRGPIRYSFPVDLDATKVDISSRDLTAAGLGIDPLPWDNPSAMLNALEKAEDKVGNANAYFANHQSLLDTRMRFASSLTDDLKAGLGTLVDADLAKEAALLRADQIKLQLSTTTLSIANAQPDMLLALFRVSST